ncbi:MAG TPA: SPOR domain-containing protein, partial [Rectinemataceae bacterium]|nr:SPOR domain-containing protein [Rectinemataceae bacterium]
TGLYAPAEISGADRSMAKTVAKNQGAEKSLSQAKLQVGWFSKKENAETLAAKLKKQGFSVQTEEQDSSGGEKRWAVIVEAAGDWSKTQARLKDLDYESYLLP